MNETRPAPVLAEVRGSKILGRDRDPVRVYALADDLTVAEIFDLADQLQHSLGIDDEVYRDFTASVIAEHALACFRQRRGEDA